MMNLYVNIYTNADTSFPRHIILDNGTFHQISVETKISMENMNFHLVFDPLLACYFNPIEEFFSYIDNQ